MKYLALVIVVAVSIESQAWLLIEPIFGYNKGQYQAERLQGIGLGARLGFQGSGFFLAADVGYHDVQQATLSSVKYTDMGATFGLNIKSFRVWYGMITGSTCAYKSGVTDIKIIGTGSKFGVGGEISSKLSLNIEARTIDYSENTTGTVVTPVTEISTVGFLSLSWII